MRDINEDYGRDLDLNLLRVFVVVARTGSVTRAAARLYLTQPAVSAAMRRLTASVGKPLFVRSGRGLMLTQHGEALAQRVSPLLEEMVRATLSPAAFDPRHSERTLRLGLSDAMQGWLLPPLLRELARTAPQLRLIAPTVTSATSSSSCRRARPTWRSRWPTSCLHVSGGCSYSTAASCASSIRGTSTSAIG
jgi:LysR family transcriptional activator of mexEF-oprN operon